MADVYDIDSGQIFDLPSEQSKDKTLADIISDPTGLIRHDDKGAVITDPEMQALYAALIESSLKEIQATPGTSTFLYMLIERSVFSFVALKAMERVGVDKMDLRRYNQLFTLFQKCSASVLEQMKKLFQEQSNLQYIFVSKVVETVAGTLTAPNCNVPPVEAEKILKAVRDNLYALIQQE
jgi:hypothetical protein